MKLVLTRLPLKENDILLVTHPNILTAVQFAQLNKQLQVFQKKLPYKNKILLFPMDITVLALQAINGKFKIINEKITVVREEDL